MHLISLTIFKYRIARFSLLAVFALMPPGIFANQVHADDYNSAVKAYISGDYALAHTILVPLANQGNSKALYSLAMIYMKGQGVDKNAVSSVMLFSLADQTGSSRAASYLESIQVKISPDIFQQGIDLASSWEPGQLAILLGLDTSGGNKVTKTSPELPFFELPTIEGDKYAYHTVPVLDFPTAADIAKLIPMPPEADFGSIPPLIAPGAPVGLDYLGIPKAVSWLHADLGSKSRQAVFAALGVNNILYARRLESTVEKYKDSGIEQVPFETTYLEQNDDTEDAARQLYTGWAAWSPDEPARIEALYRFDQGKLVEMFFFRQGADKLTSAKAFDQDNNVTTVLSYYNDGVLHVVQTLNGDTHGVKAKYQQDGTATAYTQYENDEFHGLRAELYDTGSLYFIEHYVNGKEHGTQTLYSKSGTMLSYREMQNGELHGISYSYDKNNLSEWFHYKSGKKTGPYRTYSIYHDGSYTSGYFDANGEKTGYQWDHEFISDEDKDTGITLKAGLTSYRSGKEDGLFISVGGYDAGYKKGSKYVKQRLAFRPVDGFIYSATSYNENGEKHGPDYRVGFETHLLEAREHYKNGQRNGPWYDYWPICDTGSLCHSLGERPYLPKPEHESFSGLSTIYTWVDDERRGRNLSYDAKTGKKLSESIE